jgi:hypothetical protein
MTPVLNFSAPTLSFTNGSADPPSMGGKSLAPTTVTCSLNFALALLMLLSGVAVAACRCPVVLPLSLLVVTPHAKRHEMRGVSVGDRLLPFFRAACDLTAKASRGGATARSCGE